MHREQVCCDERRSLASPHPGSAASSIRCCVGSLTRAVLPEIWATIVFVIRALSRSF